METEFLTSFICLCISFSWGACAKGLSEKRYDFIPFYDTALYNILQFTLLISIIVGIIIAWINGGFLIALSYVGITIVSNIITQIILIHILIGIFGHSGIGAIAPIACGLISAITMYIFS